MVKPIRLAALVCCAAFIASSAVGADAAASPSFEGVSDADLQAMAKKGNADAAFAMGERLVSTDKKTAFTYYSMAAKGEHIGALEVLLEANHKADGKLIDKSQEVALLKRLAAAGSIEHHALLRDLSPENYWSIAKVTGPKTELADPALTSRPQRFTARVTASQDEKQPKKKKSKKDKATVEPPKAESSGTVDRISSAGQTLSTVKVDFSDVKDFKPAGGRQVEIAGYNDSDNVFHAIIVHQPDPVFKIRRRTAEARRGGRQGTELAGESHGSQHRCAGHQNDRPEGALLPAAVAEQRQPDRHIQHRGPRRNRDHDHRIFGLQFRIHRQIERAFGGSEGR